MLLHNRSELARLPVSQRPLSFARKAYLLLHEIGDFFFPARLSVMLLRPIVQDDKRVSDFEGLSSAIRWRPQSMILSTRDPKHS